MFNAVRLTVEHGLCVSKLVAINVPVSGMESRKTNPE
jgi:hypothetical protein